MIVPGSQSLVFIGPSTLGPFTFDPDGTGGVSGPLAADRLYWSPTSCLFLGGLTAANNFYNSSGSYAFEILGHATVVDFVDLAGNPQAVPSGLQITCTFRFSCIVTNVVNLGGGRSFLFFNSTGTGWMEIFANTSVTTNPLTGAGYDHGKLIARLVGTSVSTGNYGQYGPGTANLDGTILDDYPGQFTTLGLGSIGEFTFGNISQTYDPTYFINKGLTKPTIGYWSINLPFQSTDPSDCFTPNQCGVAVGQTNASPQVQDNHTTGKYSVQATDGGIVPNVGDVNYLFLVGGTSPDFVTQATIQMSLAQ